jgi:hypothetical protein
MGWLRVARAAVLGAVVFAAGAGAVVFAAGAGAARTTATRPQSRAALVRAPAPLPEAPLWGVTVDHVSGLKAMLGSLAALPEPPTVRVYFDVHEPASYYAAPVAALAGVGQAMGELLDSSDEQAISTAEMRQRAESYVQAMAGDVAIWEIGNEVNGNWTGNPEVVAEKLDAAYDVVTGAGGRTALTLYENDFGPEHCGDGESERTPVEYARRYVPADVASGLDYVLLSYYPTQCGGVEPGDATVAGELEELHAIFQHALLGFGEVGLPHPAKRRTLAQALQIMGWAYSLNPQLPYYAGGYFWWYGAQDALRKRAPLREALGAAFEAEAAALL